MNLVREFFNPRVARVPRVVEALAGSLEARISIPSSLHIIMSGNKSVRDEIEKTLLPDVRLRGGFTSLVR